MKKNKTIRGVQIKKEHEAEPPGQDIAGETKDENKLNLEYQEKKDRFKVFLNLPGVKPDDIKIQCNVKSLEASIRRKGVKALTKKGMIDEDARYQWIEEMLELPTPIRPKKAKARLKKGQLKIILPKKDYLKFHSVPLKN